VELAIKRVNATFGAELLDIDLAAPLDDEVSAALRAALADHLVLFARNQHLEPQAHLALARVFGEPMIHPFEAAMGRTDPLHRIVDRPEDKPDRAGWHTDDSYLASPPVVGVLCCEVAPEVGGDTAWANMAQAFEDLSDSMRAYLRPLRGFHAADGKLTAYMREHLEPQVVERVMTAIGAGAEHPIVWTHPESGRRAIYTEPNFLTHILGLPESESRFVRQFLAGLAANVSIQCRFRWSAGDVAIWDERMTQHTGSADHAGHLRVLRRCTVVEKSTN